MTEGPTFWESIIQAVGASSLLGLAVYGAAGGATSALVVRVSARQVVRHIALGVLVAAGIGPLAGPLIGWALHIDLSAVQIGGLSLTGSTAYLAAVLLPGVFEVLLTRIRGGVLPGRDGGEK